MGCILSCFRGLCKVNKGWEKEPPGKTFTHILNNGNTKLRDDQNLSKSENFFDGVNFANADESESQEDFVYQEAIRSLMNRNDSNRNRENEEEENSLSGE